MSTVTFEFIAWLLKQMLNQGYGMDGLIETLLYNVVLITAGLKAEEIPELNTMLRENPELIFTIDPSMTRHVKYYLTSVDSEGVWSSNLGMAWKLEDIVKGNFLTTERLSSAIAQRVAFFKQVNPMHPRIARLSSPFALAPAVPATAEPVQAPAVPTAAERRNTLGDILYRLVGAELEKSGSAPLTGKITGMLLDALKEEKEINAAIEDSALLFSYISQAHQVLVNEAKTRSTLEAAAKKLETVAVESLAGTIMAAISGHPDVLLSHDELSALAMKFAGEALHKPLTTA